MFFILIQVFKEYVYFTRSLHLYYFRIHCCRINKDETCPEEGEWRLILMG